MIDNLHYNKVATILLKQTEPISIDKLSLISGLTIKELKEVLSYFNSCDFLSFKDNYNKILLNKKARG
jgi:chromosome segregation and condensation protein ScpB